ncbi:MAG: branched-chain amino acid ABC transporter permease [Alphaproteobacteria bacterium]|nr:branched-chain amino acid ABC transporter permease [Alphaproteobacteria bacterium]
MAFDVIASTFQQKAIAKTPWRKTVEVGLIGFGLMIYFNIVGLTGQFMERWIIESMATLAHTIFLGIAIGAGALAAHRNETLSPGARLVHAALAGLIAGAGLAILVEVLNNFNVRFMFVAMSPKLLAFLSFGVNAELASLALLAGGVVLGAFGGMLYSVPGIVRKPLVVGLASVWFVGLFAELILLASQFEVMEDIRNFFFTWEGQRLEGAIVVFCVAVGLSAFWTARGESIMTNYRGKGARQQKGIRYSLWLLAGVLFILFPMAAGSFFGQVLMLVGLYALMGMGLNIEIGLAGLLDMGFVAFFATGAYTIALFTVPESDVACVTPPCDYLIKIIDRPLTWFEALPLAMLASLVMGVLFGIPVLKVRGDYLAVATLGLGEIIRVVAVSDMAAPMLGGSQGLLSIPRPVLFDFEFSDPIHLFYLTLVSTIVAAYFAWALENSRLGRAWMAIREDEDVGQALGVNLVDVKLLAYGLGAVFAGLAGAIFAAMLASIYPHSFQLLISINILALIIVGGIGSLPGVIVGSAMLIGTPELLREFGEFRFLAYGIVLVIMMRVLPLGLWPSSVRKRELQTLEEAERLLKDRGAEGQKA